VLIEQIWVNAGLAAFDEATNAFFDLGVIAWLIDGASCEEW